MKKLVFLGTCQTRRLEVLYAEKFSPITGDTTEFIASFENITPRVRELMETADVILAQVADTEQKVAPRMFDTKARIIEFPYVSGMFLWPYSGRAHIHNKKILPRLPDGPYGAQLGNPWLNARIKAGAKPEDIAAEYEALDLSKAVNLDRTFELALNGARKRDQKTGFAIADIIEARLTDTSLFMTPDNFELPLFGPLATGVYSQLGISQAAIEATLEALWRSPFPILDHPIHPSVARHFGLKYIGPNTRYRTYSGEKLTFSEWIGRYVRYEWNDTLHQAAQKSGQIRRFDDEAQATLDQLDAGLAASNGSAYGEVGRSHLLYLKGDRAGALAATRRALAFEPTNPQIHGTLAIYLAELGQFDEAIQVATGLTTRWPHYADGWNRLANVLSRQGKLADAIAALRHAVALEPRGVEFTKHLVSLLLRSGHAEEARHVLTNLIVMIPENADLCGELSRVLGQLGDSDGALIAARRAVAADPASISHRGRLADLLVDRGDLVGAAITLREAMTLGADRASLCMALGGLMIRLGRSEEAIAQFREAITLDPKNVHLHQRLADTLYQAGELDGAEQSYRTVLSLDPGQNSIRGTLAVVIGRRGRHDEALAMIAEAMASTPDDPHMMSKQAYLLTEKGALKEARAVLERAVDIAPSLAGLHGGLADLSEREGDRIGALAAYQKAMQLEGSNIHFRRQADRLSRLLHPQHEADAAE